MQALSVKNSVNCKGKLVSLEAPVVMGILNLTPDSFYAGSRVGSEMELLKKAERMLEEGATFLDAGGQSTRPGALPIGVKEETERVVPAIRLLIKHFPEALLSVDTYLAEVASAAIGEGACMVNDVSGGLADPKMVETIAALKVPYVLMHMQGTPQTMQQSPQYRDVFLDVADFFAKRIQALRQHSIPDIILDPGFGFGKTANHNFELLNRLDDFRIFGLPILAGLSRKAMIRNAVNRPVEDSLAGTLAAETIALMKGAKILRVHDVAEAMDCIRIVSNLAS